MDDISSQGIFHHVLCCLSGENMKNQNMIIFPKYVGIIISTTDKVAIPLVNRDLQMYTLQCMYIITGK